MIINIVLSCPFFSSAISHRDRFRKPTSVFLSKYDIIYISRRYGEKDVQSAITVHFFSFLFKMLLLAKYPKNFTILSNNMERIKVCSWELCISITSWPSQISPTAPRSIRQKFTPWIPSWMPEFFLLTGTSPLEHSGTRFVSVCCRIVPVAFFFFSFFYHDPSDWCKRIVFIHFVFHQPRRDASSRCYERVMAFVFTRSRQFRSMSKFARKGGGKIRKKKEVTIFVSSKSHVFVHITEKRGWGGGRESWGFPSDLVWSVERMRIHETDIAWATFSSWTAHTHHGGLEPLRQKIGWEKTDIYRLCFLTINIGNVVCTTSRLICLKTRCILPIPLVPCSELFRPWLKMNIHFVI